MIETPDNTPDVEASEAEPSETPDLQNLGSQAEQTNLLDLDSVEKFKFAGREWTPKDLKSAYMMQSDYTKKTQEIAQERKFADNLSTDLTAVLSNPALVNDFKKIYPAKYHAVVDRFLNKNQAEGGERSGTSDPAFMTRLEKLETQIFEREVLAAEAEIDSTFKDLGGKFPMADEALVISYAQSLLDKGEKVNAKVFESLFKQSHEKNQTRLEQIYSKKVGEQKKANSMAKDMASGGGTLGKAPTKFRTVQEATTALAREFEKQYK